MTAILFPLLPDLTTDYWRVPGCDTSTVVNANGVRVHLDHQARVLRARLLQDLSGAVADPNRGAA